MRDLVKFNGETYDIEAGLTVEDVIESMKQLFPSAADAHVEVIKNPDGTRTFLLREKPGEKGRALR